MLAVDATPSMVQAYVYETVFPSGSTESPSMMASMSLEVVGPTGDSEITGAEGAALMVTVTDALWVKPSASVAARVMVWSPGASSLVV